MGDEHWHLRHIRESVEVLTRDAAQQSAWLQSIGFDGPRPWNVDELALNFDDAYLLVPQLRRERWLSVEQANALDRLDAQFESMSRHPRLWDETALTTSPEWQTVRVLAAEALALLAPRSDTFPRSV